MPSTSKFYFLDSGSISVTESLPGSVEGTWAETVQVTEEGLHENTLDHQVIDHPFPDLIGVIDYRLRLTPRPESRPSSKTDAGIAFAAGTPIFFPLTR